MSQKFLLPIAFLFSCLTSTAQRNTEFINSWIHYYQFNKDTQNATAKPLTKNDVFMYPNPAFDKAYFYLQPLEKESLVLIEIYDSKGNKIMMLPATTDKIYDVNVSDFTAGLYSYKIISKEREFNGTFSKVR